MNLLLQIAVICKDQSRLKYAFMKVCIYESWSSRLPVGLGPVAAYKGGAMALHGSCLEGSETNMSWHLCHGSKRVDNSMVSCILCLEGLSCLGELFLLCLALSKSARCRKHSLVNRRYPRPFC